MFGFNFRTDAKQKTIEDLERLRKILDEVKSFLINRKDIIISKGLLDSANFQKYTQFIGNFQINITHMASKVIKLGGHDSDLTESLNNISEIKDHVLDLQSEFISLIDDIEKSSANSKDDYVKGFHAFFESILFGLNDLLAKENKDWNKFQKELNDLYIKVR